MRLSEVHAAIEAGQGPALPEDQAFATLVAIEHLARTEGIPVSALDFAAPRFGAKYSFKRRDLRESWRGRAQYLAWRKLILNAQMRFAPGDVDADPWKSLARAQRLKTNRDTLKLYDLAKLLPTGTHPTEVNDALLANVRGGLPVEMLSGFRTGLTSFVQLFENDLALKTDLLPDRCPSRIPGLRNHNQYTSMSPEVKLWRESIPDQYAVSALDYLHRLAVASQLLDGETDTLEDLRIALCDMPDPVEFGIPLIKPRTLRNYINRVRRQLGGPDPRKTPTENSWGDLRTAARAAGCETSYISAVAKPAAIRGLYPTEITHVALLELLQSIKDQRARSRFRAGCRQIDAMRAAISPGRLPPLLLAPQLTPPHTQRKTRPTSPQDPVKLAWAELYKQLREQGWTQKQILTLSYLRVRATQAQVAPRTLSQDFIDSLEHEIKTAADRTRLRAAVITLSKLAVDPEFSDLPALTPPYCIKFTHGGPGERAQAELEKLMDFMNAARTTRRGFRVAVGVHTDAMGRPNVSLLELLQADISSYDIRHHEPRRKFHADKIRNLREFIELPWTPAWRELQEVVVGTGITPLNNPVPKLLEWNPGTDPSRVTLDWAQRLDRHFRSTLNYPPHGRTYSSKKLARHLASFDALHDIPAVAQSGLLPPRIGPIR